MRVTKDLDVVVFQIEFLGRDATEWSTLNLDNYPEQRGFTASDPCWQKTGLHGTFTETQARRAIANLSVKAPELILRVVKRAIRIENTPLVEMRPAR